MTDAREIIAGINCKTQFTPPAPIGEAGAEVIISPLTAAGFRILGPDEVDPVTLEKAADAAEERAEWVPLKAGDMREAIRALATKEEGDE